MELDAEENNRNEENLEIKTEEILFDVLDQILKYLNSKDLCRAAAVCS